MKTILSIFAHHLVRSLERKDYDARQELLGALHEAQAEYDSLLDRVRELEKKTGLRQPASPANPSPEPGGSKV